MSESWHMQRESTGKRMSRALGKTTVIVRKTNLLNLSKPKEKEGRERGEEKEKKDVKERGDQGRESRGGKRESESVASDSQASRGLHTHGSVAMFTLVHKGQSPLLFYVISAFLHVSSLFWFCSKYCSIYSPVAHGLKWPSTLNPRPLTPYSLSLLKTL